MTGIAAVFALLLGVSLFVGLPHAARWQRGSAVAVFLLLAGVVYAGTTDMLGAPKPYRFEWRDLANANVLAASLEEDKAVYIWVQTPGKPEPRAYRLPWDARMAQQVQDAMQKRKEEGANVQMAVTGNGEEEGGRGTPKFYTESVRPGPLKGQPGGGPLVLSPRGD
jgi:hypothetical protein